MGLRILFKIIIAIKTISNDMKITKIISWEFNLLFKRSDSVFSELLLLIAKSSIFLIFLSISSLNRPISPSLNTFSFTFSISPLLILSKFNFRVVSHFVNAFFESSTNDISPKNCWFKISNCLYASSFAISIVCIIRFRFFASEYNI